MKQYLETRCPQLEAFLGERNFIAGDQLTYVDFLAYEMFDQHRLVGRIIMYSFRLYIYIYVFFNNNNNVSRAGRAALPMVPMDIGRSTAHVQCLSCLWTAFPLTFPNVIVPNR